MKLKFKKSDEYLGKSFFFPIFAIVGGIMTVAALSNFNLRNMYPMDWLFILVPGMFSIGGVVASIYSIKGYFRNQGIESEIKPDGIYITKYQELIKKVSWNEIQGIEYFGDLDSDSQPRSGTTITIQVGGRNATYRLNLVDIYGERVLKIKVTRFDYVIQYLKLLYQYEPSLMNCLHAPYYQDSYRFDDVKRTIKSFERESFQCGPSEETILNGQIIKPSEDFDWMNR